MPEHEMQAALSEGDLAGTPSEVGAIEYAYRAGVLAARAAVYDYAGPDSPWHKDLMRRIDELLRQGDPE